MTRRILVPLDGSDLANEVIPWVDELASALQADVELIRVLERDVASDALLGEVGFNQRLAVGSASGVGPVSVDAIKSEAQEQEARLALSSARSRFQRARTGDITVLGGSAAETIVARAYASSATLIAMASHGRTGLARTVLGSVAGVVVRDSPVPVLVVRRDLGMPAHAPRRVLVPLDMSELAEAALWAIAPLARELRWQIILFVAIELPPQTFPVQGAAIPLGLPPSHTPDQAMAYLEALATKLKAEDLDVAVRLGSGNTAEALALGAEQSGAGIIAMSTHGRRGVGRWVLGSVTEAVISRATVPVLVVRPPQLPLSPAAALSVLQAAEPDEHRLSLTLTPRQAGVVRLALEHLAWSAWRNGEALQDIRDTLAAVEAAALAREVGNG